MTAKSNAREGDGVAGLPAKWRRDSAARTNIRGFEDDESATKNVCAAELEAAMQAQQVADGFVLAPVMPTAAMFDAGFAANSKQYAADQMDDVVERTLATYAAMIAATGAPR